MKANNSLRKNQFVLEHVYWAVITWIWYKNILFRCIDAHSFIESKLILCGIVVISCIAGILLQMKNGRNEGSVFFDLVLGYGIYTVLTYIRIRKLFIVICLLIAGVLSITYAVLVMCRKVKNRKRVGQILRRRVIYVTLAIHRLLGLGLALIMAAFGVNILLGSTVIKSGVSTSTQANNNEQSLSDNIEAIVLLQEDSWELLTVQEKVDVLQTVANIEQQYLGLSNELNVGAANLNDNVLGYYSDKTHEIVINMDSLLYDSSWELLDTVCHEAYHSYQHRMVEVFIGVDENNKNLKMFRKANSYMSEFINYVSGGEDYCSYYYQDCESDARDYAKEAVEGYYLRINEYLSEKGG